MINPIALLIGWILDVVFGDPVRLPHPVVWFGRMIAFGEKRLNHGSHRQLKGALLAVGLIALVFCATWAIRKSCSMFNVQCYSMPLWFSIVWQEPLL